MFINRKEVAVELGQVSVSGINNITYRDNTLIFTVGGVNWEGGS